MTDSLTTHYFIEGDRVCLQFYDLETNWHGTVRWTPQMAREMAGHLTALADQLDDRIGLLEAEVDSIVIGEEE